MIRPLESIARPFDLAFKDVRSDRALSIEALRGKIILIDFWATCVPGVVKLPEREDLR